MKNELDKRPGGGKIWKNAVTKPVPPKLSYKSGKKDKEDLDSSNISDDFPLNQIKNSDLNFQSTSDENRENVSLIFYQNFYSDG